MKYVSSDAKYYKRNGLLDRKKIKKNYVDTGDAIIGEKGMFGDEEYDF